MRLIRMLLLPVLALTTLSAHADDKDVARLTQLLEKSQTLTARFSQLTLDGGGTQLQETAGEMSLQRPGLFYWHTDAPAEQTMVSDAKEAGGVIDFTLKPKTKDTLFDSLRLSFRNGLVNDMQLIDSVGQRTNILFTGVKANEPIAASKFKFVIPKGADVIQE
jgi:outer membrane lipoprotein carrier protein